MRKLIGLLAVSSMVAAPMLALAQQEESDWQDESAAPQEAQPQQAPPAPPAQQPPAPQAQAQTSASVPPGQWVWTQQYGWVWMAYGDQYTSVPAGGYGTPYAYVYYPAYGWAWLAAPWIWGIGPWPFFGVYGAARFGWYGHGWWRYPSHWHYASVPAYRPGGWGAVRPGFAPYRPGAFRGGMAPGVRGGGAFVGHGGFGGGRSFAGGRGGGGGGHAGGGHGGGHH